MMDQFPKTNYIVFDFETTGFLHDFGDEVIQMSALLIEEGKEPVLFNEYVETNQTLKPVITELTGITNALLKEKGVTKVEAWRNFYRFIHPNKKAVPLIGHNIVNFDCKFLMAELSSLGCPEDRFPKSDRYIDTAMLYKAMLLNEKPYESESHYEFCCRIGQIRAAGIKFNLGKCCEDFKIDVSKFTAHQSDSDVLMTNLVYQKLLEEHRIKKEGKI